MKKAMVGDVVRLKKKINPKFETSRIETVLSPKVPGGVKLETYLMEFRYWNEEDLVLVYRPRKGKK